MGALVAAYAIIWLGVTLYVARLGAVQRKVTARLQALHAHIDDAIGVDAAIAEDLEKRVRRGRLV